MPLIKISIIRGLLTGGFRDIGFCRQGVDTMAQAKRSIPAPKWSALLLLPSASSLLLTLLSLVWSVDAAFSVAIGASTALLPTVYFAFKMFRYRGAAMANVIVHEFYRAESGKFVLTAVMFALTFAVYKDVVLWALFAGFVTATISTWLAAHRSAI
jgi:ATP synthase protein I